MCVCVYVFALDLSLKSFERERERENFTLCAHGWATPSTVRIEWEQPIRPIIHRQKSVERNLYCRAVACENWIDKLELFIAMQAHRPYMRYIIIKVYSVDAQFSTQRTNDDSENFISELRTWNVLCRISSHLIVSIVDSTRLAPFKSFRRDAMHTDLLTERRGGVFSFGFRFTVCICNWLDSDELIHRRRRRCKQSSHFLPIPSDALGQVKPLHTRR